MKPVGKRIYTPEDLKNLPIDKNGDLHLDGILMGPDGKWWIDEEGNAHFAGEMAARDIDPQYIQLDNASSGSVPNASFFTESDVLKYKNPSGGIETVPVGTVSGSLPKAVYNIDTRSAPGYALASTYTNTITCSALSGHWSSVSSRLFVSVVWFGWDDDGGSGSNGGHTPRAEIQADPDWIGGGFTTLAQISDQYPGTGYNGPTYYSGALFALYHPNRTSGSVQFRLLLTETGGDLYLLHSGIVAFECIHQG